jgi:predicted hydrocarbon binding protein
MRKPPEETLEKELVLAAIDALRAVGGEKLVRIILRAAGKPEFEEETKLPERILLADYFHFRDTALEILGNSFGGTAFQAGQVMMRNLKNEKVRQIGRLIARSRGTINRLPLIGQAAVLAAKGNPGIVRATMRRDTLLIRIVDCPECRGLQRQTPFCFLTQGLIVEFAHNYLNLRVTTRETQCAALGDPCCEIKVVPLR